MLFFGELLYSNEYSYTENHVTEYKSEEFDTVIYKNKDFIKELDLDFPSIDFGSCYDKLKQGNNITQELITVIINKNDNNNENNGKPSNSYSFFDPVTGEQLNTDICKNDTVLVEQNILSLLNENMSNYEIIKSLMDQGINIFDKSDSFYSDICYDYNYSSKIGKDIALQDRIKLFYPNISLCDADCTQTSINLENYTAICECQFNNLSGSPKKIEKKEDIKDILMENLVGDILDFFSSSNIKAGKCFSKSSHSLKGSYGIYIAISLFVISGISSAVFYLSGLNKIKLYVYQNMEKYLNYINLKNSANDAPPKRIKSVEKVKKIKKGLILIIREVKMKL